MFIIIFGPYSMRYTNNYVGKVCKSNMRSLNVSIIALSSFKLSLHVKVFIKAIFYEMNILCTSLFYACFTLVPLM